jgi:hypothetical protein
LPGHFGSDIIMESKIVQGFIGQHEKHVRRYAWSIHENKFDLREILSAKRGKTHTFS